MKELKLLPRYAGYLRGLKRKGEKQGREARYFFFSQYFVDGIRITLEILLPALILSYFGHFETGLVISLGAFCTSITDTPGPVSHKRNGMLYCAFIIFAVAIITGFARLNDILMGLEILFFTFLFSMFLVYGNRAGTVGGAATLIMILTIDEPLTPEGVLKYSALILAGGLWYMALSLLFSQIRPYRPAQRTLGVCIHEIAKFLRIKADFYTIRTNLEEDYSKLVAQQVVVSEKLDAVREIMFKTRMIVKESSSTSRLLILTFTEVVDLYEDIMATYYDYTEIREKFGRKGVLDDIAVVIKIMAVELDNIGFAIQSNSFYKKQNNIDARIEKLKAKIDKLSENETEASTLVLKKVLVNLRNLNQRLDSILNYFTVKPTKRVNSKGNTDYSRFVAHQSFSIKNLRDNLTLNSSIFRHSLRLAIACLFGFVLTKLLNYGEHSYWVIMTISVILKPAFSLTKQRNIQRLAGTAIGGIIGVLILFFVKDTYVLFAILVLFMLGTYSFLRINYIMLVIFVTPFILILFRFMGYNYMELIQERMLDTILGGAIAFGASYLLFPSWESAHLKEMMQDVVKSNLKYLKTLLEILTEHRITITEYKLVRKEVYVSSANLAAAFQRMLSEPKSKQTNRKFIHQFVVLNHILTSNIATIASSMLLKEKQNYPGKVLRPLKQSIADLQHSLEKILPEEDYQNLTERHLKTKIADDITDFSADEKLLKEQLEFIHKVSGDIGKLNIKITRPMEEIVTENTNFIELNKEIFIKPQ